MRFSIGKMMLLIAVCALNIFLLSMIGRDPKEYGVNQWFGELILLGGLPMADVLAVVALLRRPGRRHADDPGGPSVPAPIWRAVLLCAIWEVDVGS